MIDVKDIVFCFLFVILFCLYFNKTQEKEKFTNQVNTENIKNIMNEEYKIDVDAIRNLSNIATDLQKGGLTIAGNLKITGNLEVDNKITANEDIESKKSIKGKHLKVEDSAEAKRLKIINRVGNPTLFNSNNTGQNFIRGKLTNDGEVIAKENITSLKLVKGQNLEADDLIKTKRLSIINNKDWYDKRDESANSRYKYWRSVRPLDTHFNFEDSGKNYIRGESNYFDAKNWVNTTWPYDFSYDNVDKKGEYIENDDLAKTGNYIGWFRTRHHPDHGQWYSTMVTKGWSGGDKYYHSYLA